MVALSSLVRGKGPLSPRQIKQVRRWVNEDWEAHEYDSEIVALVNRLLLTIEADRDAVNRVVGA